MGPRDRQGHQCELQYQGEEVRDICRGGIWHDQVEELTPLRTVADVCRHLQGLFNGPVVVVETGCAYYIPTGEVLNDCTTYCLANYLDSTVFSIDIDPRCVEPANTLLKKNRDTLILGDSVRSINLIKTHFGDPKIDILCLDSGEDPNLLVNEFKAARTNFNPDKHAVLIDDIHNGSSVKYKKIVPLLYSIGYTCTQVPTPTGMLMATWGLE